MAAAKPLHMTGNIARAAGVHIPGRGWPCQAGPGDCGFFATIPRRWRPSWHRMRRAGSSRPMLFGLLIPHADLDGQEHGRGRAIRGRLFAMKKPEGCELPFRPRI